MPVNDLFQELASKRQSKKDFKKMIGLATLLPEAGLRVDAETDIVHLLPQSSLGDSAETGHEAEEALPVGCVIKIFGTGVSLRR
jgi:hypothetical protein